MTEYCIINYPSHQLAVMEDVVQAHLNQGWELNGQLHSYKSDTVTVFAQSLVRYDDAE